MSVMKHIFATLLLRCKEPPMHKQHCRSVTARIGFSVDSDLHEKSLHRIGSRWSKNHVELDLYVFVSVQFFFVFRSAWICCPFKNTESDITWWDSHNRIYAARKIGFGSFDPILSRFEFRRLTDWIYKDWARPGRGRRWAWASPLRLTLRACSSRCALAARARGLRALAASAKNIWIHTWYVTAKNIWIHT
jgi:hypothetical protein